MTTQSWQEAKPHKPTDHNKVFTLTTLTGVIQKQIKATISNKKRCTDKETLHTGSLQTANKVPPSIPNYP